MAKLVKEGRKYPFITGDDVIITKGINHSGKTVDETIEEVDNTLDEHKKEIDKLKSNLKYVYSYGGVGGKGSGGGDSSASVTSFASLNKRQLKNDGSSIILNGPGLYPVDMSISNAQGRVFLVELYYGNRTRPVSFTLNMDNKYKESYSINLNKNGEIVVKFFDADTHQIAEFSQFYIVNPHTFDTKFMYEFNNGVEVSDIEFNPYEYFVGNTDFSNPFLYAEYKIDVQNVSNVSITYSISGTTFDPIPMEGTKNSVKIKLDDIIINNHPLTHESNTGKYTVSITLQYTSNASEQASDTKSFDITIVPNHLYINVRNPLIFDTLDAMREAIDSAPGGIPDKSLNIGTYTSFYCKVFEGSMITIPYLYDLIVNAYDVDMGHNPGEEVIGSEELIKPIERTVTEQQENAEPISIVFGTPGVKMIEFKTQGRKSDIPDGEPTRKYIYVKNRSEKIESWYPGDLSQSVFYFRANSADDTYSKTIGGVRTFPQLSSGNEPWELSESGNVITLTDSHWASGTALQSQQTTILSLGMQYSAVNRDSAVILKTYADLNTGQPDIVLYSDKFDDKNICIPGETNFDKTVTSNYHLVQIVRHKIGFRNTTPQFATYLYIDGKLEANYTSTSSNQLVIRKIVFNNVNVIYNHISIQYASVALPDVVKSNRLDEKTYTIDELIYQYYLKYKDSLDIEITDAEKKLFDDLYQIRFDGEDVIVTSDFVSSISPSMPIPTLMMEYTNNDSTIVQNFKEKLFKGYKDGGKEAFGTETLTGLYWCNGNKVNNSRLSSVGINQITDGSEVYTGTWAVELQGTSTMKNRIKNFSLILQTNDESTHTKRLLMSPNYKDDDPHTFLPEQVWTLKADIADSAHANNASIGKFVNTVCTSFGKDLQLDPSVSGYVKNTLEGFPVLMYFKIGEDVYYLGVYNFNMGRESSYNLGYIKNADMVDMKEHIQHSSDNNVPFCYSVGTGTLVDELAVGEVQENNPEFDYHQFDESVLFGDEGSSNSTMFGDDSKIKGGNSKKTTLKNFVKSVSLAGAYCFAKVEKKPKNSQSDNGDCENKYILETNSETGKLEECVPDIRYQFRYQGNTKEWFDLGNDYKFDVIKENDENLLQCISSQDHEGVAQPDYHYLDLKSAVEYYTICMAFALVDSILKNQTIKSWDGKKCYVAFYDMDCAFGEDNKGEECITYLAATDYWYSETKNGYLEPVEIKFDYWNSNIGFGFDYPSSYLFAIAKYAHAILKNQETYPQKFWAQLRQKTAVDGKPDGQLQNADYFVRTYFSSGIGEIPAYMASMNYQVKYLYRGKYFDDDGNEREDFLANKAQFNGSRIEKVKSWLNKRFHFLDVMFNLQSINDISIGNGSSYYLPAPDIELLNGLSDDVIIRSDAFTVNENSNLLAGVNTSVAVRAPKNTPLIRNVGRQYNYVYILTADTGEDNLIKVMGEKAQSVRFWGSSEFTYVDKIDPFLNTSNQITSNRLQEINYVGGILNMPTISLNYTINSTSVKKIKLDVPEFRGSLIVAKDGLYGQALEEINISGSGFIGTFDNLKNLKKINISSVNRPDGDIVITNCPVVGDGYSVISGKSEYQLTSLRRLQMLGVSGNYTIRNTAIETINMSIKDGESSIFNIDKDYTLKELELTGFTSITVTNCPFLRKITIREGELNKCKKIIIDVPEYRNEDGLEPEGLKYFGETEIEGVFDFTSFNELETLELIGSKAVVIKIPNHKVSVKTFKDNKDLEFIDTAGQHSIIELTDHSAFYNCPKYGMRQSWWSTEGMNGVDISTLSSQDAKVGNYTRMCVSSTCNTLANTFYKIDPSVVTNYTQENSNNFYTNTWGQKVYNQAITLRDAGYFINTYVAAAPINDAYIGSDNKVYDIQNATFTDDRGPSRQPNIKSLFGCFCGQKSIEYRGAPSDARLVPNLSNFTSLSDISRMYYGTTIKRISSNLLSLPDSLNNNADLHGGDEFSHTLDWTEFISGLEWEILRDAFKYISYRITNFTSKTFNIYGAGSVSDSGDYYDLLVNTDDNASESEKYLDFVDIMCPHEHTSGSYETYTKNDVEYDAFERFTSFNYFNVNPTQYIDYRTLFRACPNISTLSNFLFNDLHKSKLDGALSTCTKLNVIDNSFSHYSVALDDSFPTIDLYDFFNWEDSSLYTMHNLFSSATDNPGFVLKKKISITKFKKIMNVLHNYKNIEMLSNIFCFCTIEGYDGSEIELGEVMNNIRGVNALFYNCKSDNGTPLNITRSFFECLPNVTSVINTFYGVEFSHMLTYDFFCKRQAADDDNIYVVVDDSKSENDPSRYNTGKVGDKAILHTIGYGSNVITNMNSCFKNAKFVRCECWFNAENDDNIRLKPQKDVVEYNGNTNYEVYYRKDGGRYVKYKVNENAMAYADTLNNFTNYVDTIRIAIGEDSYTINNHNINSDLEIFENLKDVDESEYPFNANDILTFNISKTFCCLPPDLFHCCHYQADLRNVFSNTNIIGVLPQHLLKFCYDAQIQNMFENVNILPNLIYHCNSLITDYYNDPEDPNLAEKQQRHAAYLEMIKYIPVDNKTIMQHESVDDIIEYPFVGDTSNPNHATVLFRAADGELRRRNPYAFERDPELNMVVDKDFNKSQFAYVPQGYIETNDDVSQAFTFRYNLPPQTDLYKSKLSDAGIIWPTQTNDEFDSSYSPELKPYYWPYYVQYFFTVDESIGWDRLYDIRYPFITDGQDSSMDPNPSMKEKRTRVFSTSMEAYPNKWWGQDRQPIDNVRWDNRTNGIFNVFLNLCGKRNKRTGQYVDYGCPINKALSLNGINLNGFLSGILTIFLNGKIFESSVDGGQILTNNASGSVIDYSYGFGRNMILPQFYTVIYSHPTILLAYPHGTGTTTFYGHMFPSQSSMEKYNFVYGGDFPETGGDKLKLTPKYILRN